MKDVHLLAFSVTFSPMDTKGWRDRLREALKASGKSHRQVSLDAGFSHGYVNGLLRSEKDPGFANVCKVAAAAGVSLSYIAFGADVDMESEQILAALTRLSEKDRNAILTLAQSVPDHAD